MGTEAIITNWWNIVGGFGGAALLVYFILMVHYTKQKDRHVQELQVQVAEMKGLLLGRQRGKQ